MNPRVVKLRDERAKNVAKIASLQERNKKIDADIIRIENTDIIGMVREYGLSPDMLFELITAAKKNPIPSVSLPETIETEEENSEEEFEKNTCFDARRALRDEFFCYGVCIRRRRGCDHARHRDHGDG